MYHVMWSCYLVAEDNVVEGVGRGRGRGRRRRQRTVDHDTAEQQAAQTQFSKEDYDVIKDDLSNPDIHKLFR